MLSSEEKKKSIQAVKELKTEISSLRDQLNEVDNIKEDFFSKREQIGNDISKRIKENIVLKNQRNDLTAKVKGLKVERDVVNAKIKELVDMIDSLDKQKQELMTKNKVDIDPSELQRQIKHLEDKIETDAMSFEAEKKTMKLINSLRKKYAEVKDVAIIFDKKGKALKEVRDFRRRAKDIHISIQNLARESQAKHEAMLEASKGIDDLKTKESELNNNFVDAKKKFHEINSQLKDKFGPLNEHSQKLGEDYEQSKAEVRKKEEETLKKKDAEVKDKMKKGRKLTTEDILVFQKMNEE